MSQYDRQLESRENSPIWNSEGICPLVYVPVGRKQNRYDSNKRCPCYFARNA